MRTCRWPNGFALLTALFVFLLSAACSRHGDFQTQRNTAPHPQQVPFHEDAQIGPDAAIGSEPASQQPPRLQGELPFDPNLPQSLPAGTLLNVRLETPISTAVPGALKTFTATLETPVTVGGFTVWPHGAVLKGRVACAHSSMKSGVGLVCLTLDSIAFGDKIIPLQTSNLFVKGRISNEQREGYTGIAYPPNLIEIEKGHRLTFRLTREVALRPAKEEAPERFESGSR